MRQLNCISAWHPQAWAAITELCGGEDRVNVEASTWGDSFIVNLGTPALEGAPPRQALELDNWHVDGDFFVHFLDSPEQALLVIPLFSDIAPGGGATEMAVSVGLQARARSVTGVEGWPFRAVADAMEVIPRTLVQNSGGNAIRVLTELRVRPRSSPVFLLSMSLCAWRVWRNAYASCFALLIRRNTRTASIRGASTARRARSST